LVAPIAIPVCAVDRVVVGEACEAFAGLAGDFVPRSVEPAVGALVACDCFIVAKNMDNYCTSLALTCARRRTNRAGGWTTANRAVASIPHGALEAKL